MSWTVANIPDQTGRNVIVTGSNSGLGLEIATQLARAGASVTLACRNAQKAAAALSTIRGIVPAADVAIGSLDLADLASVAAFAQAYRTEHQHLDVLINNAGLMATDRARTVDGFEMQFGVNHLGHYALTNHLLPLLIQTPHSRVATMSSMGHRAGWMHFSDLMGDRFYQRWLAYTQSKLANLLFTAALQRRLTAADAPTIAVAAHPGASNTDLGFEGHSISNRFMKQFAPAFTQPVAAGALPMLRAATDPAVKPGEFYGCRFIAVGVPVRERPSWRARNAESAEKLWDISARLTGVDAFIGAGSVKAVAPR